jgi:hypothetical protein
MGMDRGFWDLLNYNNLVNEEDGYVKDRKLNVDIIFEV